MGILGLLVGAFWLGYSQREIRVVTELKYQYVVQQKTQVRVHSIETPVVLPNNQVGVRKEVLSIEQNETKYGLNLQETIVKTTGSSDLKRYTLGILYLPPVGQMEGYLGTVGVRLGNLPFFFEAGYQTPQNKFFLGIKWEM